MVFIASKKLFSFFKIFKFLSGRFGHARKQLDKKVMVNFKIYDVIKCETNNCNTHIFSQYLKK